jgi:hypothetical protein
MTAAQGNPLELPNLEAAAAHACRLVIVESMLGTDAAFARATQTATEVLKPLIDSQGAFAVFLRERDLVSGLSAISNFSVDWREEQRDLVGLYATLYDTYVPQNVTQKNDALYWRRVDSVLEVLNATFASHQALATLADTAEGITQGSRSLTMQLLTDPSVADLAATVFDLQIYATGIWLPGIDSALRWGQTRLEGLTDQDLASLLARDLIMLNALAGVGATDQVADYVAQLKQEIREMGIRQSHRSPSDARTKNVAMFRTVLLALADDEDQIHREPAASRVAPDFLRMRLTEARTLAIAEDVDLFETDGRYEGEGSDTPERSVIQSSNWVVWAQRPTAGTRLHGKGRITVWILKRDENHLSKYQVGRIDELDRLGSGRSSS